MTTRQQRRRVFLGHGCVYSTCIAQIHIQQLQGRIFSCDAEFVRLFAYEDMIDLLGTEIHILCPSTKMPPSDALESDEQVMCGVTRDERSIPLRMRISRIIDGDSFLC